MKFRGPNGWIYRVNGEEFKVFIAIVLVSIGIGNGLGIVWSYDREYTATAQAIHAQE